MKIPEYIFSNVLGTKEPTPFSLYDLFTNKISEVENTFKLVNIEGLVIGKVLTCEPHPDSDHLHVTTVDIKSEVLQIVCGAPNVAKDLFVIVATVGCQLSEDFIIKKSTIRGVESNGMLCSLQELGIPPHFVEPAYQSGIYFFPRSMSDSLGETPLNFTFFNSAIYDLKPTSNRYDLESIYGLIKEVANAGHPEYLNNFHTFLSNKKVTSLDPFNSTSSKITIEEGTASFYSYHIFENAKIQDSPWFIKTLLIANGIKPINNLVDISNFMMLWFGLPLHFFDLDKLSSDKIDIRYAHEDEKIKTLDGTEHTLNTKDILVTNKDEPICLAGIYGLKNSGVSESTKRILVEMAVFNSANITSTAQRLNLKTVASNYFTNGINISNISPAIDYLIYLMSRYGTCKYVKSEILNVELAKQENTFILDLPKFNKFVGKKYKEQDILDWTEYTFVNGIKKIDDKTYEVSIKDRDDVNDIYDFAEEVTKAEGFDKIKIKALKPKIGGQLTPIQKLKRDIRQFFQFKGFNEVISYSLYSQEEVNTFNGFEEENQLIYPLTIQRKYLRQNLAIGLLANLAYNKARSDNSQKLFEVGKTFTKKEQEVLSFAITGDYYNDELHHQVVPSSLFIAKGILEEFLNYLNIQVSYKSVHNSKGYHPYNYANILIGTKSIGYIAEIHPLVSSKYNLSSTYIVELNIASLITKTKTDYVKISPYPNVERDISFIVGKDVKYSDIEKIIFETSKKKLISLKLFDYYQNPTYAENVVSMAINMVFNDPNATLNSIDIDKIVSSIKFRLEKDFNAEFRK